MGGEPVILVLLLRLNETRPPVILFERECAPRPRPRREGERESVVPAPLRVGERESGTGAAVAADEIEAGRPIRGEVGSVVLPLADPAPNRLESSAIVAPIAPLGLTTFSPSLCVWVSLSLSVWLRALSRRPAGDFPKHPSHVG